jgi:hypothetical protein
MSSTGTTVVPKFWLHFIKPYDSCSNVMPCTGGTRLYTQISHKESITSLNCLDKNGPINTHTFYDHVWFRLSYVTNYSMAAASLFLAKKAICSSEYISLSS